MVTRATPRHSNKNYIDYVITQSEFCRRAPQRSSVITENGFTGQATCYFAFILHRSHTLQFTILTSFVVSEHYHNNKAAAIFGVTTMGNYYGARVSALPHKYSIYSRLSSRANLSHCSSRLLTDCCSDCMISAFINRTHITKPDFTTMPNTNCTDGGMSEQKVDC